jgi:hypothetical protein
MRNWKDFITAYVFVYFWCMIVAWEIDPSEWTENMRLVWMILGFFVFAMVHNERKKNEQ